MFPTINTSSTQLANETSLHPVRAIGELTDLLSEFAPGQKLLAEIKGQLANGAYRATIAQREITLALPFAAKTGDALELEVVKTNGRVALAVIQTKISDETPLPSAENAPDISPTGQLISKLLTPNKEAPQAHTSLLLANGQPISPTPPENLSDIAPLLKNAIQQSGLFYESHQAQWVGNAYPESTLAEEPQAAFFKAAIQSDTTAHTQPKSGTVPVFLQNSNNNIEKTLGVNSTINRPMPDDIVPIVQQQLNSLSNNIYAFHGMAWPGQKIEWEIVDEDTQKEKQSADEPTPWKTRLHLSMPSLGNINASLQINGDTLTINLVTSSKEASQSLRNAQSDLQQHLSDAGLQLNALQIDVNAPTNNETNIT